MITKEDLDEWKKLENGATSGPWIRVGGGPPSVATNAHYSKLDKNRIIHKEDGSILGEFLGVCKGTSFEQNWEQEWRDLAFIAASREAVPALIKEVERLQALYLSVKDKGG